MHASAECSSIALAFEEAGNASIMKAAYEKAGLWQPDRLSLVCMRSYRASRSRSKAVEAKGQSVAIWSIFCSTGEMEKPTVKAL